MTSPPSFEPPVCSFDLSKPRHSFTHVSTHQTYVGKALFEHAPNCATIAAVACMSSSLLKSSLGPNLLALIRVDDDTLDLFDKIFLEHNPHMQLTQKLACFADDDVGFIAKLKSSGPLFISSLLYAEIYSRCLPLFDGFRALRSLTLTVKLDGENLAFLRVLSSLSELKVCGVCSDGSALFKSLGDFENNRNLTSLDIASFGIGWCSQGFDKDFCGRLLSKNRLTKLALSRWRGMSEADVDAFVKVGMTNLVELRDGISAKWIRGAGFRKLRILSVHSASDEDLVNIGNQCVLLEVLETEISVFSSSLIGSFLTNTKLEREAFVHLRSLKLQSCMFSAENVGDGFSRLPSLENLCLNFASSSLQYLPNPSLLRSIECVSINFEVAHLRPCVNLAEIKLGYFQISHEDILAFALFKQLNLLRLCHCGTNIASSEPFRVLCPQLPNLEELGCSDPLSSTGRTMTRWTEEDVEAILAECSNLRKLRFEFKENFVRSNRVPHLQKKYPLVIIKGELFMNKPVESESGSTRGRE